MVLDALLERVPWADAAIRLFDHVESGVLIGQIGATTATTIHYIARRHADMGVAAESIEDLLRLFEVAPVDRAVLGDALGLGFDDFEDAVLHEAGRHAGADAVVTRDPSGFAKATLRVYEPRLLVAALGAVEEP